MQGKYNLMSRLLAHQVVRVRIVAYLRRWHRTLFLSDSIENVRTSLDYYTSTLPPLFFAPLPVPPPAAFMLCFCASPSAPARPFSPLLPPFLPVLHLLPCPCSTTPSACRLLPPRSPYRMSPRPFFHLVSPPRVAVVLRLRAAVSGRFLPPLPRTLPLFPGRTLPDTSSLERGAGCSVRGLPIKQKSPKSALWSSFIARSG